MSVNVEYFVEGASFELGRILAPDGETRIELETLVPAGSLTVPFFWVEGADDAFEARIRDHESVSSLEQVDVDAAMTLYAFDWNSEDDQFFRVLGDAKGHVLRAGARAGEWHFELWFPDHAALSAFQVACEEHGIELSVVRITQFEQSDRSALFGLTRAQREALTLAVERGYFDIPRQCSTAELAAALDISDQAVSERLRRGVVALVRSTLLADDGT